MAACVAAPAGRDDVAARILAAISSRDQMLGRYVAPHASLAVVAEATLRGGGPASKELNLEMRCPHGELQRLNLEVPGRTRCIAGAVPRAIGWCA